MQGMLKRLGENFGFFDTPDGDVYVRRSDLPQDAHEGDRYEFETADRGGRNPVAVNIRFIGRGAVPPARRDDARGRDRPVRERATRPPRVTWPESIKTRVGTYSRSADVEVNLLWLSFFVTIREGEKPKVGKVTLKAIGAEVVEPEQNPIIGDDGQVYFTVGLPEDAVHCDMALSIWENDRVVGISSYHWDKIETAPKVCKHIKAESLGVSSGYLAIRVETLTAPEGEGIGTEIAIESVDEIEVLGATPQVGRVVTFTTPSDGKALIQVKFTPPTWRGNIIIRSASDSKIRTEPIYLRQPRPAPQTI